MKMPTEIICTHDYIIIIYVFCTAGISCDADVSSIHSSQSQSGSMRTNVSRIHIPEQEIFSELNCPVLIILAIRSPLSVVYKPLI